MKKLLLIICFLFVAVNAFADASLTASSARDTDIRSILSTASASTGVVTVTIPPGTETHTSSITINMSTGYTNVTSLIIQGSGEGVTNIANSYWVITTSPAKKFEISKMTLTGTTTGSRYGGMVEFYGTTSPTTGGGFRYHHITSVTTGSRVVFVYGQVYGVFDNNNITCDDMFGSIRGGVYTTAGGGGNTQWAADDDFGSANAVYIEGNTLTSTKANPTSSLGNNNFIMDGDGGSKTVVRYNTATNFHIGQHDTAVGALRSNRSWEYYNNYIINLTSWGLETLNLRGGTGYAYNNVTYAQNSLNPYGHASMIYLRNARDTTTYGNPWNNLCDNTAEKFCQSGTYPKVCNTDADCGGGAGSCTQVDTNTDTTGYPCRDQLGRAKDQSLRPALFWNNKTVFYNASETAAVPLVATASATHIQNNRDYCYHATTMPETCNGIATSYTAYTCPHPLTGYTGSCDTATAGVTGYNTDEPADEVAPTVTTVYVNGADLTINFIEPITATSGAAFTLDPSGADVTVSCPAVATAATSITCTISRALTAAETATYGYTGTKVIDVAENALATIEATNITLNQTPAEAPTKKLTISKTGTGCTITSSPSGISCGSTCEFDFTTATQVTLGGYLENGWASITYGGDCAANGTVTVNEAKTCTVVCTPVYLLN